MAKRKRPSSYYIVVTRGGNHETVSLEKALKLADKEPFSEVWRSQPSGTMRLL
jgi:hypothetical protein